MAKYSVQFMKTYRVSAKNAAQAALRAVRRYTSADEPMCLSVYVRDQEDESSVRYYELYRNGDVVSAIPGAVRQFRCGDETLAAPSPVAAAALILARDGVNEVTLEEPSSGRTYTLSRDLIS